MVIYCYLWLGIYFCWLCCLLRLLWFGFNSVVHFRGLACLVVCLYLSICWVGVCFV